MRYQAVLFELDGTLTDPFEGITKSVQFALQHFGINEPNLYKLKCFIGPPFRPTVEALYGLTPEQSAEGLQWFRERFTLKGVYENKLYCGIPDLLDTLKRQGVKLAIASAKPHVHINRILIHFGIDHFFDAVAGSELDGRRTDKTEIILHALDLLGMPSPTRSAVMVGHRGHDAVGAQEAGVDFVAARYASLEADEFADKRCMYQADSIDTLKAFLAGQDN